MFSQLKKGAVAYFCFNIANACSAILLIPLLVYFLGIAEYGKIAVFESLSRIVYTILMSLSSFIIIDYYKCEKTEFSEYLFNSIILTFIVVVGMLVLIYIISQFTQSVLEVNSYYLLFIPFISLGQIALNIISSIYQADYNINKFITINVIVLVVNVTLTVFFIAVLKMNYFGRIIALFFTNIITIAIFTICLKKMNLLKYNVNIKHIKSLLYYNLPLLPHNISVNLIQSLDRIIVQFFCGSAVTGIYSIGYKLGSSVTLIQSALHRTTTPYIFRLIAKLTTDSKNKIVAIGYIITLLLFITATLVSIFSYIITRYVANNHYNLITYVATIIAFSFAINGIYAFFANFIFYNKKSKIIVSITVSGALINLTLSLLLVRYMGAIGASVAILITMLYTTALTVGTANKYYSFSWFKSVSVLKLKRSFKGELNENNYR